MTTLDLVDAIRPWWTNTVAYDGQVRGESAWHRDGPAGVMVHHTAPPQPYPLDSLAGGRDGRLKANIAPRQNGQLVVITAAACNYSSGLGSSLVLDAVRAGVAPTGMAKDLGLADNTNGNPWFWNLEVDHPGNGAPIPFAQWNATVAACAALCARHGWGAERVIAHAEWTGRKNDPRWDNRNAHQNMNAIRAAVALALDSKEPPVSDHIEANTIRAKAIYETGAAPGVDSTFVADWQWMVAQQIATTFTDPDSVVRSEELAAFLHRLDRHLIGPLRDRIAHLEAAGPGGGVTEQQVRELIAGTRLQP